MTADPAPDDPTGDAARCSSPSSPGRRVPDPRVAPGGARDALRAGADRVPAPRATSSTRSTPGASPARPGGRVILRDRGPRPAALPAGVRGRAARGPRRGWASRRTSRRSRRSGRAPTPYPPVRRRARVRGGARRRSGSRGSCTRAPARDRRSRRGRRSGGGRGAGSGARAAAGRWRSPRTGARACGWPSARARSDGWTSWRARWPTSRRPAATSWCATASATGPTRSAWWWTTRATAWTS